jgi:hypothetical protein
MEKPVNAPNGWHLKKEFIAEDKSVWSYGKMIINPDGTPTGNEAGTPAYLKGKTKETISQGEAPPQAEDVVPKTQKQNLQIDPMPKNAEVDQLRREVARLTELFLNQQKTPTTVNVKEEVAAFGNYDDSKLGDDDYLEDPDLFICYGRGFALGSYFRMGKLVKSPINDTIYFKRQHDETTYHDDNAKIIPFSGYPCYSKAISKFIKESPYFGITIVLGEEKRKLKQIGMNEITEYETVITSVNRMTDQDLVNICHGRGLDIRLPKDQMRAQLIKTMIQDVINKSKELVETRKSEMIKEAFEKPVT